MRKFTVYIDESGRYDDSRFTSQIIKNVLDDLNEIEHHEEKTKFSMYRLKNSIKDFDHVMFGAIIYEGDYAPGQNIPTDKEIKRIWDKVETTTVEKATIAGIERVLDFMLQYKDSKITIYVDNKNVVDYLNENDVNYKGIIKRKKKFSNLRIRWISRDYNNIANDLVRNKNHHYQKELLENINQLISLVQNKNLEKKDNEHFSNSSDTAESKKIENYKNNILELNKAIEKKKNRIVQLEKEVNNKNQKNKNQKKQIKELRNKIRMLEGEKN